MAEALTGSRLLLTTDAVGGVWTYSLDLAREYCSAGNEVVLAVLGPAPSADMAEAAHSIDDLRLVSTGLPLDWLAERPDDILEAGRQLARLAAERRCDLVQLHAPAFAAARSFASPMVSVHHSCVATWWAAVNPGRSMPEDLRWRSRLVAEGLAASDAIVAPTTAHAHAVAETYHLAAQPLAVRNGRRTAAGETFTPASERAPFVLTSGRLWDQGKNAAALDRAAALLGIPVYAAGSASAPQGKAPRFSALRLLGNLGEAEMRLWLTQSPIYASTALYEPFGLGVLEAAQAGCALILSDIPAFRELWAGACLFVPPHDEHAIAREISRLLSDARLLSRLSDRARHRAQLYTPGASAREMMRLHAGLLALRRVGQGAAA